MYRVYAVKGFGLLEKQETSPLHKTRILDCAEQLFAQNGFANTKMLELAKMADVNHALTHYYYGSKEKLYEEVIERLFRAWESKIKVLKWTESDPRTTLNTYIREYYKFYNEYKNFYSIRKWDNMERKNVFSKYIDQYWSDDLKEKCFIIEKWKDKGFVRKSVNPKITMFSIWSILNYFFVQPPEEIGKMLDVNGKTEECTEELVQQITDIILNGIL